MKSAFVLLIAVLTMALPIGLTSELFSAYGLDAIARSASSSLRKQYPLRQQLANELAGNARVPVERIDEWEWQALHSLDQPLPATLPYAEQWLVLSEASQVVTFTATAREGRVLEISSHHQATARGGLIIEIFDLESDGARPVASMGPADELLREFFRHAS